MAKIGCRTIGPPKPRDRRDPSRTECLDPPRLRRTLGRPTGPERGQCPASAASPSAVSDRRTVRRVPGGSENGARRSDRPISSGPFRPRGCTRVTPRPRTGRSRCGSRTPDQFCADPARRHGAISVAAAFCAASPERWVASPSDAPCEPPIPPQTGGVPFLHSARDGVRAGNTVTGVVRRRPRAAIPGRRASAVHAVKFVGRGLAPVPRPVLALAVVRARHAGRGRRRASAWATRPNSTSMPPTVAIGVVPAPVEGRLALV